MNNNLYSKDEKDDINKDVEKTANSLKIVFILMPILILLIVATIVIKEMIFFMLGVLLLIVIFAFLMISFGNLKFEEKKSEIFDVLKLSLEREYIKLENIYDVDIIKSDFEKVLSYHEKTSNDTILNDIEDSIQEVSNFRIKGKEVYVISREIEDTNDGIIKTYIDFFIKLDIPDRLCITTNDIEYKEDTVKFEDIFLDKKEKVLIYDSKYFDEIKNDFSQEFYYNNFSEAENSKYLELDDSIKNELLKILKQYKTNFSIFLKDRLLIIEISEYNEKIYHKLYENVEILKKVFESILEIFLKIEKEEKNIRFSKIKNEYAKVKNLIFDLDNTIIRNSENDCEFYRDVLIKTGNDENDVYMLYDSLDRYEENITEENIFYNREEMLKFINEDLERDYSIELVNGIIETIGNKWIKMVMLDENVVKNLASKYNLYLYTNFFKEAQEMRLEKIGYKKYFKKVFAADTHGSKPFKKSFEIVLKEIDSKPEECIMIGDKKEKDILAANNIGMKSILLGNTSRKEAEKIKVDNYIVIEDINDVGTILL